jgi:hypothetical protein
MHLQINKQIKLDSVSLNNIDCVQYSFRMSDTDSDSDSDISENSIFEDLEKLIESCHAIHSHLHNSSETLQNLHQLVANNTNIQLKYKGELREFDDILEELHAAALKNIEETGANTFGELLRMMLFEN